ncbi:MAG: hypothetical protein A3G94_02480 [Deltaproteobacteria bacterium RIFCSPLOWO2_12_FULL_60_16]|nr:MAG: hypothetical protein A3G94_02480 [Deltaproteobacteria bacterium RIFCSPLOWO2_12_FULL_60_16]
MLTALSLSKWSAFPEGAIASILRDASGGKRADEPMLAYAQMGLFQRSVKMPLSVEPHVA